MARTGENEGRNLRGHSANRVVIDEAAFVSDKVIEEVVSPMLADNNGDLVMISTPFGKNHFYRAYIRGMEGLDLKCRSYRFPSYSNPYISSEYIEYQKSILTPRQYKVEYEAEFADDDSSVFPWSDIQAAIDAAEPADRENIVYVAGVDWARYSDFTAVVILEAPVDSARDQVKYRVAALDRFNKMMWQEQVNRAAKLLCDYNVCGVAADQTSVGDPVMEMLRDRISNYTNLQIDIEGITFTNQTKREMIDNRLYVLHTESLSFRI